MQAVSCVIVWVVWWTGDVCILVLLRLCCNISIMSLAFKAVHVNIDSTCVCTINSGKLGRLKRRCWKEEEITTNKAEKCLRILKASKIVGMSSRISGKLMKKLSITCTFSIISQRKMYMSLWFSSLIQEVHVVVWQSRYTLQILVSFAEKKHPCINMEI